eukprot:scaffold57542_cov70-Phaeocystis_antarctica.AAC.1
MREGRPLCRRAQQRPRGGTVAEAPLVARRAVYLVGVRARARARARVRVRVRVRARVRIRARVGIRVGVRVRDRVRVRMCTSVRWPHSE